MVASCNVNNIFIGFLSKLTTALNKQFDVFMFLPNLHAMFENAKNCISDILMFYKLCEKVIGIKLQMVLNSYLISIKPEKEI